MGKNEILFFYLFREPWLLQLVGASSATATIPFQVFHWPSDLLPYPTWLERTMSVNPVEAIYGLYKMVCCFLYPGLDN